MVGLSILSLDARQSRDNLPAMAKRRTIGNRIAPPRFMAFLAILIIGFPIASKAIGGWALGAMAAFDLSAALFLILCLPLLRTRHAETIRGHAKDNDANREMLLAITGIVMAVLLTAVAAETVGHNPEPFTKGLIIGTLALAWLFSNTLYALHYAHLAYGRPAAGCAGLEFPDTPEPIYWDFVYFAFTLGMTFQTSDVTISSPAIRRVVTVHSLAAFVFNIGVLAFTINVLGSS
jgi:uncharacterized membrane protein